MLKPFIVFRGLWHFIVIICQSRIDDQEHFLFILWIICLKYFVFSTVTVTFVYPSNLICRNAGLFKSLCEDNRTAYVSSLVIEQINQTCMFTTKQFGYIALTSLAVIFLYDYAKTKYYESRTSAPQVTN